MTIPGKRKSKSTKKRGIISIYPKKNQLVSCPKCAKPIMPHQVCPFCGTYQGRQIIELKIKKSKKTDKEKK